jgi:hypothetical protein
MERQAGEKLPVSGCMRFKFNSIHLKFNAAFAEGLLNSRTVMLFIQVNRDPF